MNDIFSNRHIYVLISPTSEEMVGRNANPSGDFKLKYIDS